MYYNPVKVIESNNWQDDCIRCQKDFGIQNPLIVTSTGNSNRLNLPSIFNPGSIFSAVKQNPTFESCQSAIDFGCTSRFDGVIAIGGGSVMDTAKAVIAALGTGIYAIDKLLLERLSFSEHISSIFIPTTHGTGSEVTMWGTIWNIGKKKKYSISHSDLYPEVAILDGYLTLSLQLDISLITVLDALSHSFEAIWNKNANPQSTEYAMKAICLILENVEKLKDDLNDIETRKILLRASNIAGLAFSNTKTAAAHSISYPLTVNFGIPHGIASSLTLIPLLNINESKIQQEIKGIVELLELDHEEQIKDLIHSIPGNILKYTLREWGVEKGQIEWIAERTFTKGRMGNNIVNLIKMDVITILEQVY